MDVIANGSIAEVICIGFARGDMFLEGIRDAVERHEIENGVVLSGMGTFDRCRMHYTTVTTLPPNDEFIEIEGALELASVDGMIVQGVPHLHMTVGNMERTWAAHLEDGCRVLYLAEVVIGRLDGLPLERRSMDYGIKELHRIGGA